MNDVRTYKPAQDYVKLLLETKSDDKLYTKEELADYVYWAFYNGTAHQDRELKLKMIKEKFIKK